MKVDVSSIIVPTDVQSDIQPDSNALKQRRIIKDNDNFLVNLTHILTRIHKTFYRQYDKTKKQQQQQIIEIPNLKKIIPKLKNSVFGPREQLVLSGRKRKRSDDDDDDEDDEDDELAKLLII